MEENPWDFPLPELSSHNFTFIVNLQDLHGHILVSIDTIPHFVRYYSIHGFPVTVDALAGDGVMRGNPWG